MIFYIHVQVRFWFRHKKGIFYKIQMYPSKNMPLNVNRTFDNGHWAMETPSTLYKFSALQWPVI